MKWAPTPEITQTLARVNIPSDDHVSFMDWLLQQEPWIEAALNSRDDWEKAVFTIEQKYPVYCDLFPER